MGIYIYIYIYINTHTHIYIYIYIHILNMSISDGINIFFWIWLPSKFHGPRSQVVWTWWSWSWTCAIAAARRTNHGPKSGEWGPLLGKSRGKPGKTMVFHHEISKFLVNVDFFPPWANPMNQNRRKWYKAGTPPTFWGPVGTCWNLNLTWFSSFAMTWIVEPVEVWASLGHLKRNVITKRDILMWKYINNSSHRNQWWIWNMNGSLI